MQVPVLDYEKFAKYSGGALLFGIIYGFILFPNIVHYAIKQQVQLKPGSKTREELYLPIPFEIEFTISVWNITNPEEVQAGGMPKMQEVGPFFFLEKKIKYNVEDDEEQDTMSFDQKNTFFFLPNKTSPLTGNEIVTIPHPVITFGLLVVQRDSAPLIPMAIQGLDEVFNSPKTPFLTATVYDLLFNGIPINCDVHGFQAQTVCSALEDTLGESSRLNETHLVLSLLKAQNDTDTGRFTVYRGTKNISDVGRMALFNGEPELDFFDGDECNELKGTDALFYPPFQKKENVIWGFPAQLCRSIGLTYKKDASYKGVALKRFSYIFNKDDPDCFCRDPDDCHPYGTVDMSICIQAPLMISKPHFLDADPAISEKIQGMKPTEEDHDILADFDLLIGEPLNARSTAQFSLDLTAVEEYEPMSNLRTLYLPMFWITESIRLEGLFVYQFKALHIAQHVTNFVKYICIIFGMFGLGGFTFLAVNGNSNSNAVDEEVIVERGTANPVMYPDDASDTNIFEGIIKTGSEFRDKIASKINFGSNDENEKK